MIFITRRRFLASASATLPVLWQGCSRPNAEEYDMEETPLDASVLRRSVKDLRLEGHPIRVNLPLLERLYDLNAEVATKFPAGWDNGMGQMGLLLSRRVYNGGYWCTPTNSLSFGGTGGDGAHFSLLITGDSIDEETPVIVTVPDNFGEPADANVVLGRGFKDFLRLGLHCGYFSMAQFSFNANEALEHYSRTDWDGGESWFPSDNHRVVAEHVAKTLNFTRLVYSPAEFEELQVEFKPLMRFKDEG